MDVNGFFSLHCCLLVLETDTLSMELFSRKTHCEYGGPVSLCNSHI